MTNNHPPAESWEEKLSRLEMDDGDGCAVCLGEMLSIVNFKLLADFLSSQIKEAEKRILKRVEEEVFGEVVVYGEIEVDEGGLRVFRVNSQLNQKIAEQRASLHKLEEEIEEGKWSNIDKSSIRLGVRLSAEAHPFRVTVQQEKKLRRKFSLVNAARVMEPSKGY